MAASAGGGSKTAVEPFDAFLASVSSATYEAYATLPGARVRDAAAFQEMREYVLTRYRDAHVERSFTDSGGVFDCIRQADASPGSAASCPAGSVPTRRVTLADLVRFPTLHDFFSKAPDGTGQLPMPPSSR